MSIIATCATQTVMDLVDYCSIWSMLTVTILLSVWFGFAMCEIEIRSSPIKIVKVLTVIFRCAVVVLVASIAFQIGIGTVAYFFLGVITSLTQIFVLEYIILKYDNQAEIYRLIFIVAIFVDVGFSRYTSQSYVFSLIFYPMMPFYMW